MLVFARLSSKSIPEIKWTGLSILPLNKERITSHYKE